MVSVKEFIDSVKVPLADGWGYIYGTAGRMWTEQLQKSYSQPGHKNYEMTERYGAKWIGRMVTDCSGLLLWALRQHGGTIVHQARYQYTDASSPKGKLVNGRREDGQPILPGTAVFLKGKEDHIHHVGVYVGGDTVIEAKGTFYGVVTSHLNHWDHWGQLKAVDYTGAEDLEVDVPTTDQSAEDAEAGTVFKAIVANPQKWLNVRSGAGREYPVRFQVEKGSIVDVLDAGEPDWWQIRYGGQIGWAYAEYLKHFDDYTEQEQEEKDEEKDGDLQGVLKGLLGIRQEIDNIVSIIRELIL